MSEYNRKVASQLCDELVATVRTIAESIKAGPEEGPRIDDTCRRLGWVLSELKTTIRS
jgi:hypothetical protein